MTPLRALAAALSVAACAARPAFADAPKPHGVAVVAQGSAQAEAWPLARAVYADPLLRPSLDEKRARVLAGEAPEAEDLRDLAELRAGVRGDDAASREVLATLADRALVEALLVVQVDGTGHATAREFFARTRSFDAAVFVARRDGDEVAWPGVTDSLHARYAAPPPPPPAAPRAATKPKPSETSSKPFYLSPWFWGAIGAGLVGGLAVVLATQDASGDTMKLRLTVPR